MRDLSWERVGLPWIGGRVGDDRRVALRRKVVLGVIGGTLGAMLAGCTANKPPSDGETSLANVAKDVVIPLEAGKMKNPQPESDEVVSRGQQVFLGSCAQCHGADGRAGTSPGRNMYPPAMDLHSAHVQHWNDGELFWIIRNGVRLTGMPSWQSIISEDDTWKLVRFIHSFPRMEAASPSTTVPSQAQPVASAEDKYTLKVPNGLAFSEFRGYEDWQTVSISQDGPLMAVILGNPIMINAYRSGIPGNGKPFPDGAEMAKVHWKPKKLETFPAATVPGIEDDVDFMVKDSKRFPDSGGWGYGVFEFDAASGKFRIGNLSDKPPQGNDAKCGFTCHSTVKTRDFVFTEYAQK